MAGASAAKLGARGVTRSPATGGKEALAGAGSVVGTAGKAGSTGVSMSSGTKGLLLGDGLRRRVLRPAVAPAKLGSGIEPSVLLQREAQVPPEAPPRKWG